MFCLYYTALLCKERTWLVAGILRNETNLVFDRCLDKKICKFEFFVPKHSETDFLSIMHNLEAQGLVSSLQSAPNRLADTNNQNCAPGALAGAD